MVAQMNPAQSARSEMEGAPEVGHDLDLGAVALDIVEQQFGAAGPLHVHPACMGDSRYCGRSGSRQSHQLEPWHTEISMCSCSCPCVMQACFSPHVPQATCAPHVRPFSAWLRQLHTPAMETVLSCSCEPLSRPPNSATYSGTVCDTANLCG